MALEVKEDDEIAQGISDILSEFADIIYDGALGDRDPLPFVEHAKEFAFDALRERYPSEPEGDLREAAEWGVNMFEVW